VGSSGVHPLGRTWREYYFPGKDFVPPIIQSRITVFSAGSQPLYRIRDDSLGWGGRTNGGIEVECIPGGHLMHLREPHVRSLAEKVRARVAITPVA
jgi:thioesterase domain-containing protein